MRIAQCREGHITHITEWADYVVWFIDRGDRVRRSIEAHDEV